EAGSRGRLPSPAPRLRRPFPLGDEADDQAHRVRVEIGNGTHPVDHATCPGTRAAVVPTIRKSSSRCTAADHTPAPDESHDREACPPPGTLPSGPHRLAA